MAEVPASHPDQNISKFYIFKMSELANFMSCSVTEMSEFSGMSYQNHNV